MNYLNEYNSIIDYRIKNPIYKSENQYIETHHIKPRSFFINKESDDIINHIDNLVNLTGEEHFLVHYYLFKHYHENDKHSIYYHKSIKAFEPMDMKSNNHKDRYFNAKLYEEGKVALLEYNKQQTILQLHEICKFINNNDRLPSQYKNDEKTFSNKIYSLREGRNSNGNHLFYKEYQELVETYNIPDLFYTNNEKELIAIKNIKIFFDSNNKIPNKRSKDPKEKKLANNLISIKNKIKNNKLSLESSNYINEIELNINNNSKLDFIKTSEISLIGELYDFVNMYNKIPNPQIYNQKSLYQKFQRVRNKYRNKKLNQESLKLINKLDLVYIFEVEA